ncbi:transcription antitermination factor NusB [bacterium Unc6]|nr:transcription antitermination factor NusB [bacterium Unc6]
MRRRTLAREFALKMLYLLDIDSSVSQIDTDRFWEDWGAKQAESVCLYTKKLIDGTIKNKQTIDQVIQKRAENWELKRMSFIDRSVLRLATYELLYENEVPPNVVINEAIDIAKKYGEEGSGGFVNGILDKINKEDRET